jgi:hypothetical protein
MSALSSTIDRPAGTVTIHEDGAERWTYHFGASRRPFVHPLRTPAGVVRTVDAPDDHPWHHGLWFTIKFVNGENFWEEYDEYGVLRHRDQPPIVAHTEIGHDDVLSVHGHVDWIRPDRRTVVLREDRRWTHRPLDATRYALDFETTLVPTTDVELDRTPFTTWGGYGGLAFRGRPDLRDTRIRLADGVETDRVEGVPSRWLDLSGVVDGRPAGLTFIDAPDNPTHPVPWYGSTRHDTYGTSGDDWSNFLNAAFLFHAPRTLGAGEPLRFRYRIVVHDGEADPAAIEAQAADYHRELAP